MNRQAILIAFLFATAGAGIVLAALEGEKRYDAYVAENPAPKGPEADASATARPWNESRDEPWVDREQYVIMLLVVGVGAYLWLLMLAFQEHPGWGVAVLLGNGLAVLIFVFAHPDKALKTAFVMYGSFAGAVWALYYQT